MVIREGCQMSVIKGVWAEELDRLKRIYEEVQKTLENYPKGSIQIKKIKNKEQHYLVWHEEGKMKSKYIGNDPVVIEKIKIGIGARKAREKSQRERLKDMRLLERALRLKVR